MESLQPPAIGFGHRSDIDGLRAVAVMLVIFNHVEIHRFSGGFIGVDVFFVISGYLISSLILKEIAAGSFSVERFYERRFRRIIPALAVMLAIISVFAYVFFFPLELNNFAQSEAGALFSFSNVIFWKQTGYFSVPARLAPLLHTWSLGVEEQFYIVFPVLMLVLSRWLRRYLALIIGGLTAISFLVAWYWTIHAPTAAYFLAPYRGWEFLTGTLLALRCMPFPQRPLTRNVAGAVGLLCILIPGIAYTSATLFPGPGALLPCIGAALVIAAGETGSSMPGQLLSSWPLRWTGIISYSLYLWHWPLQVFQTTNRLLVPDHYPTWVAKLAVIVVSFPLAVLSWRFVEQPFRTGRLRGKAPLFALNGALLCCLAAFSGFLLRYNGWPPATVWHSAALRDFEHAQTDITRMPPVGCYIAPEAVTASFANSPCLASQPGKPQYLLLGDSHAAAAYWGLKTAFPELNIATLATFGCPALIFRPAAWSMRCSAPSNFIYGDYLLHHKVDTVVLVARWSLYDLGDLGDTIDWIHQHGMKVVVIGPSIEYDGSLIRIIEIAKHEHDPGVYARHRDYGPEILDRRMAELARDEWHVPYISTYQDLCEPQAPGATAVESAKGCPVFAAPGMPLLWDSDHFTAAGSLLAAQAMRARGQLP